MGTTDDNKKKGMDISLKQMKKKKMNMLNIQKETKPLSFQAKYVA